jgi:hypothetical protein
MLKPRQVVPESYPPHGMNASRKMLKRHLKEDFCRQPPKIKINKNCVVFKESIDNIQQQHKRRNKETSLDRKRANS